MKKRIISKYLTSKFETCGHDAEWYGYYNYDTLNHDKTLMLCNQSPSESHVINAKDKIGLGYYNLTSGEWHLIDTTDSWNWQQGAMMQWLPGKCNENKVIYNCSRNGHLVAKIKDIKTNETKDIDWAIYGLTPDGKKSISLDFERSYWCRAYHYQSVTNIQKEGRIIEGDGIYEIDLQNNTRKLLIDIHDIVKNSPDSNFDSMKHWVEHIMINPSGTKFCFLHRFSPQGEIKYYKTRICIANIDGSGLQVIPGWNKYMWSHFGWKNDSDFVIYTYKRLVPFNSAKENDSTIKKEKNFSTIRTLIKIAVGIKDILPKRILNIFKSENFYYQYYECKNGKYELADSWKNSFFNIDGHPSFTSDGRYMLTDSYPDDNGYRRYIIFDTMTHKGMIIAKMPENKQEGNVACDLHPKLSKDNLNVVFDTTSSGKHSMILFDINWDIIKKKISK